MSFLRRTSSVATVDWQDQLEEPRQMLRRESAGRVWRSICGHK